MIFSYKRRRRSHHRSGVRTKEQHVKLGLCGNNQNQLHDKLDEPVDYNGPVNHFHNTFPHYKPIQNQFETVMICDPGTQGRVEIEFP